ncbi:cytochrome P450 [Phaeosphaeriaceae sp. PMI808]|nr:cytochrome P450 [Phaeosphaeriaceae sp. PMI808]
MNTNTKDVWNHVLQPRSSAIFTRDEYDHKERRKVWTQSLSTKSMDSLRPRIADQVQSLVQCIDKYAGAPVDIDEAMSWFSFDAMGEVVFGEDFDLLNSRVMRPAILHRDQALAILGPIADAIWIARLAFLFVLFYGKKGKKGGKPDIASWFIEDLKGRDNLLSGTIVSTVVVGSDTTRASLIAT